jgi:4-amino-4-deoxy-L-arabinose transferase-like glycosyltransferase
MNKKAVEHGFRPDLEHRPQGHYARWFWRLLVGVALFRAAYLWMFPFDLVGDEAYYWDWGRQLDWGYFSKPPGIAWLMALAGFLGGNTPEGLRLFAVLLGTGGLALFFLLGRRLFDERVAFWACLATLATPGNTALNVLLTIDAPLVFCWIGALYCFWRLCEEPRQPPLGIVLALIGFLGCGALSKQMMLVFYPLGVLFLLTDKDLRGLLRSPWLWLGSLAGFAFLLPPLLWNAANDWITFRHTSHHFEGDALTIGRVLKNSGEYLGTQLGILTPVTWSLTMLLAVAGVRRFSSWPREARFLWIFSAPALLVVALMSLRQGINPNWPAVYYAAGFLLVAGWWSGKVSIGSADRWRNWFKPGVAVGAGLVLFALFLPVIIWVTGLRGSDVDPFRRLNGWSALAAEVQAVRGAGDFSEDFLLTVGHRYNTSQLAFYLPDQPTVFRWPNRPGRIESQYELWGLPGERFTGKKGLIVAHEDVFKREKGNLPATLVEHFEVIWEGPEITVELGSGRQRTYRIFFAEGWRPGGPRENFDE